MVTLLDPFLEDVIPHFTFALKLKKKGLDRYQNLKSIHVF